MSWARSTKRSAETRDSRSAPEDALTAAARLLAARPRSRAALVRLLEARGFSAAAADGAAERCVALGYLREHELAQTLARDLLAAGHAPAAVRARLVAKQLDEATAQKAVDAEVKASGWSALSAAKALLAKRRLSGARAVRFLLARGFEEETARAAAGFDEM